MIAYLGKFRWKRDERTSANESLFPRSRASFVVLTMALSVLTACSEATAPVSRAVLKPSIANVIDETGCSPYAVIACPPDVSGGGSPSVGIRLSRSWDQCITPSLDTDGDGLDDECEVEIARAFAPMLIVTVGECNWDAGLDRVGGEYYYGVKRWGSNANKVRVAYMPAYYRDCGSEGHTGDSEFILVDVALQAGTSTIWTFEGAFLSAHCNAMKYGLDSDPDCQYWGHAFWDGGTVRDGLVSHQSGSYVDQVPRGAPFVHVSNGKHANYYSSDKCNNSLAGQAGVDYCYPTGGRRFPIVYRWQNIDFPESGVFSGVPARWGSTLTAPGATEHFRETLECANNSCYRFNGWAGPQVGGGSTSYGNHLRYYFGWWSTSFEAAPCVNDPNAVSPCAPG